MKKGKFKLDILIKNTLLFILISLIIPSVQSQEIIPGSERLNNYINKLVNKKIAVIANNTSIVRNGELSVHLIDTLLKRNIEIEKIFSPEHGFLGDKDDGEKIEDGLYKSIEVISLYGKKRKISDDDIWSNLVNIVSSNLPPSKGKRTPYLTYAKQIGNRPPKILIKFKNVEFVHFSYKRYIENELRKIFDLKGVPLQLEFREND